MDLAKFKGIAQDRDGKHKICFSHSGIIAKIEYEILLHHFTHGFKWTAMMIAKIDRCTVARMVTYSGIKHFTMRNWWGWLTIKPSDS